MGFVVYLPSAYFQSHCSKAGSSQLAQVKSANSVYVRSGRASALQYHNASSG